MTAGARAGDLAPQHEAQTGGVAVAQSVEGPPAEAMERTVPLRRVVA